MSQAIANPLPAFSIAGAGLAAALLAGFPAIECVAQERPALQVAGSYPYAASVLAAPKSIRAEGRQKSLSEPATTTIAPDSRPAAIVLPERRTAIDHMLESHEFTFGKSGRASNFSSKQPPVGTNLDLEAVKLRVSRDKVLLKAQWSFN